MTNKITIKVFVEPSRRRLPPNNTPEKTTFLFQTETEGHPLNPDNASQTKAQAYGAMFDNGYKGYTITEMERVIWTDTGKS